MKKSFPSFLKAFFIILIFLIFQFGVAILFEFIFNRIGIKNSILKLILISIITLIILIFILYKLSGENFKTLFPLKKISLKEGFLLILISIGFVVFSSELDNWTHYFFPGIIKFQELISGILDKNSPVLTFVLLCIIAPFSEEFIFRGVIFHGFQKNYSTKITIFLSSFLFAFMHLNPAQFFPAFLFGIIAGWIFFHSENLSHTILFHSISNFLSYLVLMKFFPWQIDGFSSEPNYLQVQPEPLWIFVSSFFLLNIGIYLYYSNLESENFKR